MSDMMAGTGPSIYDTPAQSAQTVPEQDLGPKEIKDNWNRSIRAIRAQRNQAAVNEQFLRNKHWIHVNQQSGRIEELPRNPDRVRATIARIGPDSQRLLAKLTSRSLTFEVPPETPDDQAVQASKIGEAALHQTADEQSWEDIRYEHADITWQAGVGGMCLEWDTTVGTPIAQDPNTGRIIHTGEIRLTVVAMHEIGLEPGTRDGEKAYWWIRGQALPSATVKTHYNLDYMPPADARAADNVWRVGDDETTLTPMTMVYTYFERPHGETGGRVITVVNDEIIDSGPWPFPFKDRLNLYLCKVWPVYGKWFGHTPVTDAVPIQTAMNASWSSIIEHMKQAGNARLWVPEGSVEDLEDLSDLPGEAVEYNPMNGNRPLYESPPVMPEWWIRQPAMLGEAMDDVLGQSDVSRGQAPAGIESGIALSVLSENADTPVGRFAKNMAAMWGRVASGVLALYEANVRESRQAQIRMPYSKIPEVVRWNGDALRGHTRAIVPEDSVMPRGRNAQMAYAFQLHDRGMVTDPVQLAKIADLPDQAQLLEALSTDTARAMRENAEMAVGRPRTVDGIDDHQNHIEVHRDFMRSARFENLPPEDQQIFRWHMQAHELYAAQQAAMLAQAASVSPMAAALPQATISPLSADALKQGAALSQMAPSAETLAAPGNGGDMGTIPDLPPGIPGPAPVGGPPPPNQPGPQQQMTQDLLEQQPPG